MRTAFAFMVAPLLGCTVFGVIWLVAGLLAGGTMAEEAMRAGSFVPDWALGAYPVVLLLSIPLFLELRAALGFWNRPSLIVAAAAVYPSVVLLLGYAGVEFHTLLRGWADWIGVLVAASVHAETFLGIVRNEESHYVFR